MNPVEVKKVLEDFREGAAGTEAVFIAVLKKEAVYFKEGGSIVARRRLRRSLKQLFNIH